MFGQKIDPQKWLTEQGHTVFVISWVNPDPRNPIMRFLHAVTEPLFRPFRKILPPYRTGNIDFSPIFVILLIFLVSRFLVRLAAGL